MHSRVLSGQGIRFAVAAFLMIFLTGCGTARIQIYEFPRAGDFPKKVAVLPFTYEMDQPEAKGSSAILRNVFFNYFGYLGYTDMPLDEVDRNLSKAGFKSPNQAADMSLAQLREALGVDAVVRGHVVESNNFTGGIYAETRIRARLKMMDLKDGKTIWETDHQEWDYSSIMTLTVVDTVQSQMENMNAPEAYNKVAESFVLKVIEELPDPAGYREPHVRLPKISSLRAAVENDRKAGPYGAIRVDMAGEPGMTATFDISAWKTGIAMVENAPGHYVGAYPVKPEDKLADIVIVGRLKNKDGLVGKETYKAPIPARSRTNAVQNDAQSPVGRF